MSHVVHFLIGFKSNLHYSDIILSYTLQTTSSSIQVDGDTWIMFAPENVNFQCRYARKVVSATSLVQIQNYQSFLKFYLLTYL